MNSQALQDNDPDNGDEAVLSSRFQDAESLDTPQMDLDRQSSDQDGLDGLNSLTQPLEASRPLSDGAAAQESENTDQDEFVMMNISDGNGILMDGGNSAPAPFEISAISLARDITGTANNEINVTYGAAQETFLRLAPASYDDGIGAVDANLQNAREISNVIFSQNTEMPSAQGMSNLLWVWGQFLDHDITLTAEGHGEALPIAVPTGDSSFDPFSTGMAEIGFERAAFASGSGVTTVREFTNEITAFIDASNVYGSDAVAETNLRDTGGYMRIDADGLLPLEMGMQGPEFVAGDVRANENVALLSMHTLFVREHNHWVDVLKQHSTELSDEQLYQTAKAIVEAMMQSILMTNFCHYFLAKMPLPHIQVTIHPLMLKYQQSLQRQHFV